MWLVHEVPNLSHDDLDLDRYEQKLTQAIVSDRLSLSERKLLYAALDAVEVYRRSPTPLPTSKPRSGKV